ncbi:uncharacterized protein LOC134231902 [Saccostrea cucullata]|uniref:uncharacterized protein LOC134231902 n=1 Tax=Saccostrea cuccullata TaxID=36930 RepID=UPI002ED1C30F
MHTFQKTYETLKAKLLDINTEVNLLKDDVDRAIEQTCGPLGNLGIGNTHLYHLTYCNFEDNEDDECTFVPLRFVISQVIPDHTFGSKIGHVFYDSATTYVSKLTSKVFQPADAYCIRFYFRLYAVTTTGAIKLSLQVGEHPGYPFHSIPASNLPAKMWILAEASPDQEYIQHPFKIILENNIRTYVYIDDIMIFNTRCNTDDRH